MIELLSKFHSSVMETTPTTYSRYLYQEINWDARAICFMGGRGVGKTTLMCQFLLAKYQTVQRALYLSADNLNVLSYGLLNIAQDYFSLGGEALFIDEVHKYPDWSIEIKNILDIYKDKQVVFSASSSLDLSKSKADLSRRVVYHELKGLSFREYLLLNAIIELPAMSLTELLNNHVAIAEQLIPLTILKHFKSYLEIGYYPFHLENRVDFLSKLNNAIEKVITEDIAAVYNLKQSTLPILKKILHLVASSEGLVPNIDKISRNLGVSREIIYHSFEYLGNAGLVSTVWPRGKGLKAVRKPGKVFMDNTNLLYAINASLNIPNLIGNVRESFFVNQLIGKHSIWLHNQADFVIDDGIVFEIGGKNKGFEQLGDEPQAYLALDDLEIGCGNKIPLYMFGLLY